MGDERREQKVPFSYSAFLGELASRGEITQKVVKKILSGIEKGKIKVNVREGVLISNVMLNPDKSISIFLPPGYNSTHASFEAPRILLDTLKIMTRNSSDYFNLEQIENDLRAELSKSA